LWDLLYYLSFHYNKSHNNKDNKRIMSPYKMKGRIQIRDYINYFWPFNLYEISLLLKGQSIYIYY